MRRNHLWFPVLLVVALFANQYRTDSPTTPASLSEETLAINHMAANGTPIHLSHHAKERMGQRHFTLDEIRQTLAHGVIKAPPRVGDKGDTIYKVEDPGLDGHKEAEVVVIKHSDDLFIVTVYWHGEE